MLHNNYFKKVSGVESNYGFGLIELMVSISIVVLVMGVVLARQSSFNSAVLLRSQAYEIALQIREIQLSAVSVVADNTGNFRKVYGLYFTTNSSYYLNFRDGNSNIYYDSGEEYGKRNNLDKRFEISAIRLMNGSGGTISTPENISIVFERPNFDARFYTAASTAANAPIVQIDVRPRGTSVVRTVEISNTGQITVL